MVFSLDNGLKFFHTDTGEKIYPACTGDGFSSERFPGGGVCL